MAEWQCNEIKVKNKFKKNFKEAKMAEEKTVEERVKDVIVAQLGVDPSEVKPEASFVDDLGADSLDTVELVMALEEEFGIEIPDEEAEKIKTVGEAMEHIKSKLS